MGPACSCVPGSHSSPLSLGVPPPEAVVRAGQGDPVGAGVAVCTAALATESGDGVRWRARSLRGWHGPAPWVLSVGHVPGPMLSSPRAGACPVPLGPTGPVCRSLLGQPPESATGAGPQVLLGQARVHSCAWSVHAVSAVFSKLLPPVVVAVRHCHFSVTAVERAWSGSSLLAVCMVGLLERRAFKH